VGKANGSRECAPREFPIRISNSQIVIASAAKQSIVPRKGRMDCFVASLLAMTTP
jgi:hypothetical protein